MYKFVIVKVKIMLEVCCLSLYHWAVRLLFCTCRPFCCCNNKQAGGGKEEEEGRGLEGELGQSSATLCFPCNVICDYIWVYSATLACYS